MALVAGEQGSLDLFGDGEAGDDFSLVANLASLAGLDEHTTSSVDSVDDDEAASAYASTAVRVAPAAAS